MELKNKPNSRYCYIDYIRLFSILMVIVLHCICDFYNEPENSQGSLWYLLGFVNELTRIGVPLFFMISGYLLLNAKIDNIKQFYKRRLSKVFIPFIIYDIFYYIVYCIEFKQNISFFMFIKQLLNEGSAYHLWFIYSIIAIYFLTPFIKKITDNSSLKELLVFFTVAIFFPTIRPLFNTFFGTKIYIVLFEEGIYGHIGYFVLGYILGKYNLPSAAKKIICASGVVLFIVVPLFSMYSAKAFGEYQFHDGFAITHYIEATAFFLILKKHSPSSSKIISSLASVTMDAYFIHIFILSLLRHSPWTNRPAPLILSWIVITTITSFLWGYLIKFSKNIFYRKKHTPSLQDNSSPADEFISSENDTIEIN